MSIKPDDIVFEQEHQEGESFQCIVIAAESGLATQFRSLPPERQEEVRQHVSRGLTVPFNEAKVARCIDAQMPKLHQQQLTTATA